MNTSKACAPRLGAIVEQTGRSVGYYGDVYHTLARPVLPFEHEAVRALELAGLAMLDAAAAEIRGGSPGPPMNVCSKRASLQGRFQRDA